MNLLKYAIEMETDGEKYYQRQAQLNSDNSLSVVFIHLAKDENTHAEILKNKLNNTPYELKDHSAFFAIDNIFKGVKDFSSEIKQFPGQFDVYHEALKIEKQSIELYSRLINESDDDNDKILFEFLIKQEKSHYDFFEALIDFLRHPYEWVESAEFGLREDY